DEQCMREIDQAIAWGKQYGIHINLNFHRGPGYCVNPPKEPGDLWSDPASQAQFARHWGIFAKRHAGIPAKQLSFDLINEPPALDGAKYAAALRPAIETIRAADANRLIIADGVSWGGTPVEELVPLGVAQSTRGYAPMEVSHYQASWINGADKMPPPVWPIPAGLNNYLFGAEKPDLKSPLTLQVQCPQATPFTLHVDHVSHEAALVVKADGAVVFQHAFKPGPGEGEWKKSEANRWGSFDADYDSDYTATIPAGTKEIQVSVEQGDWLRFSSARLGATLIQATSHDWGVKQETFTVDANGAHAANKRFIQSKETLWDQRIKPWLALAAKGVGIHVGEWGAFNHTPHDVALAWMRDCLDNWRTAGFGWALWNFRGSFGILDSGRKDMDYENFEGHQLDRKMLDLLRAS
ncbi:MAG TPA: cellulase family glycosylhydrolase, partial [Chthoniobacteraceae bacterium]|nr:cellulase family glycosylhydrolase [Chthoniobacteraceae bacterium]